MTLRAAFSSFASSVPLDDDVRPLSDGVSVATRNNAFADSAVPAARAVPVEPNRSTVALRPNALGSTAAFRPTSTPDPSATPEIPGTTEIPRPRAPQKTSGSVETNRPDRPLDLAARNNASDAAASSVAVDFVDDAGKIDWNAALSANETWLRSTIATQVGENAAVDEVFQDVALAATRQKAPIRDPRKIGAWLRRLATVYSLLYRRSLGRKKKLLQRYQDRVPVREAARADSEPLHWLLAEERRALVRRATAQLSDDERRVLTLKYAEERSYKEIAEEIGATVSAVQSKLHRARARLREKLAELAPTAISPPT